MFVVFRVFRLVLLVLLGVLTAVHPPPILPLAEAHAVTLQPCAASLSPGDTMTCAVSTAAETDTITVNGTAGEVLLIRISVTAGDLRPQVRLISPSASTVCSGAYAYGPGFEISRCVLPQTGTYTITVADSAGTRTGTYNLYLQRLTAPIGATPLIIGDVAVHTIATAAEASTFTVTADAHTALLFRMAVSAGSLRPSVRVFGADGTALCTGSNAYGAGAEITRCVLPAAGIYTVLAGDLAAVQSGTYQLTVQHLTTPIGAQPLVAGATVAATIPQAAKVDSYTLTATTAEVWLLRVGASAGDLRPSVRVFAQDGSVLCNAGSLYAAGAEISRCALPAAGSYTVLVVDISITSTGSYGLYAQRITNPAQSYPMALGTATTTTIQASAEADTYTVQAASGDVLLVRVGVTVGTMRPGISVYDPDGVLICNQANPYSGGVMISRCVVPRFGTYTIVVGDTGVVGSGSYTLYVQTLAAPPAAEPLIASTVQTSTLQRAAFADTYAWSAGDTDTLQLMMSATTATLRPQVALYDPDGVLVCQASNPYGASTNIATCLLPRRGIYTVLAMDAQVTGTGTYQISLTCLSTACGGAPIAPRADTHITAGDLDLVIPARASTQPISATATLMSTPPMAGTRVLRAYDVQAHTADGVPFTRAQPPAIYRIHVDQATLDAAGVTLADVRIAQWDATTQRWITLTSTVDPATSTLSATSAQIGMIGVLVAQTPQGATTAVYLPLTVR